jgi:membrane-bound lytic murein transglycosylase B
MIKSSQLPAIVFLTLVILTCLTPPAHAAQCGSSSAGFESWKQQFAGEARAKGIARCREF